MHFCNIFRTLAICALIANSANASLQSNDHPFTALNEKARWTAMAVFAAATGLVFYGYATYCAQQEEFRLNSEAYTQRMLDECNSCLNEGGTAHHCCGYFM